MAIDSNTLLNEARCLACGSLSTSEMIIAALLQRIVEAGGGGGGGGTPAAPVSSVQFNSAGAFGGSADLTFDDATNVLSLTGSQTIAVGANTTALALSGYSLTGANAQSALSIAGTWNTSGTPTALRMTITDTASNAASLLMALAVGADDLFVVEKSGGVQARGGIIVGAISAIASATGQVSVYGGSAVQQASMNTGGLDLKNTGRVNFSSTASSQGAKDVALARSAAGVLEVNSSVVGTFRDLEVRTIITNDSAALVRSDVAMADGAGAGAGTISNAPAAGNPTKWIPINDIGTTRHIPAW